MDAFRSANQKRISQKQEKAVAASLGGSVQANSGATKFGGGDVRAPGFRIECKYTEKDHYVLKLADLDKLKQQANRALEQPVMHLAFVNNLGHRAEYAVTKTTTDLEWILGIPRKSIKLYHSSVYAGLLYTTQVLLPMSNTPTNQWCIEHWANFLKRIEDKCL